MAEIEEQHPNDPSIALLCTQLWNMQQEQGSYGAALEQARRAYELMLGECGWQPVWLAASVARSQCAYMVGHQHCDCIGDGRSVAALEQARRPLCHC